MPTRVTGAREAALWCGMLSPEFLRSKFQLGATYDAYVASGTPDQRANWERVYRAVTLSTEQSGLVRAFTRTVNVLVSSGLWCGDCVQQCPILGRIGQAHPERVRVRFLDRDAHVDLAERVKICGGLRVPTAVFMNEDFEFVSLLGDRTLSRYRATASASLGPSCPLPGAAARMESLAETVHDWVNEIERVHLVARLSVKLRERHGD